MQHRSSVFELTCAPIPTVRIGLVGAGQRGRATLARYAYVDGAEFRAVADPDPAAVASALELLREQRRPLTETSTNAEAWRELCRREDIDLIYICTDWSNHAAMAVEAMRCGKHVAVEVPAATTVVDCWELVRTAEATQRHCFMTENCCYDWFALATLDMHRRGVFGTITHCEGAYLHDWSALFAGDHAAAAFYRAGCRHGGNPYPTHAIGPIAQLLGFHRRDRMMRLSSVTGMAAGRDSLLGHANHTLITTERGVTI
ncbi:MAG: Gfo/Idh/MocA family oxidoreductase, partial [Prevotellaceae bacterium]|nr:Gfo/Idh/MocA family oxidoreductase [Prevotellaceae bacterium]